MTKSLNLRKMRRAINKADKCPNKIYPPRITDRGCRSYFACTDGPGIFVDQYAVWEYDDEKEKYQVTETSDNLQYLKCKYEINEIINIGGKEEK